MEMCQAESSGEVSSTFQDYSTMTIGNPEVVKEHRHYIADDTAIVVAKCRDITWRRKLLLLWTNQTRSSLLHILNFQMMPIKALLPSADTCKCVLRRRIYAQHMSSWSTITARTIHAQRDHRPWQLVKTQWWWSFLLHMTVELILQACSRGGGSDGSADPPPLPADGLPF